MMQENETKDFNYSGTYYRQHLHAGKYKIEAWGASGGNNAQNYREGYGAYVSGIINFPRNIVVYIFPGEKGRGNGTATFGGGGTGSKHNVDMPSGGGATDVRLKRNDLYSRIIVAGAGGASVYLQGKYEADGGDAGGLEGFNGTTSGFNESRISPPSGGSQTKGGWPSGEFGKGGSGFCGGGGGYFGGSGSTTMPDAISSAAGGSSFISGYDGCIAPKRKDRFHASGLFFTDAVMKSGKEEFNSPEGILRTGHVGNGHVRITFLESHPQIGIDCTHYSSPKNRIPYVNILILIMTK